MSQNNKIFKAQNDKISKSQNDKISKSQNNNYLIEDILDDKDSIISWTDLDSIDENKDEDQEVDEDDEIIVDEESEESDDSDDEKKMQQPQINFDVVEKNKKKSVKISINLNLDETSNLFNIEFSISKEVFLKIAKELS